ncbi:response regulator [Aquimarina mytili]|uniref:Response regulator transcription factor n=1 Tax=Aquimarina mytili TaxID=874423 RepID=A0A936ZQC0_9FLAO|nr:response regulator transcription factor [Aquimarina mytili]MBL0682758.1 response regulator transcription factor [Aquimarina mytili]
MSYNIIIVDDHSMFLDGLLSIFDDLPEYNVLFTAKDGENVIKYLQINSSEQVDLIITDLSMPNMDGITLNQLVKESYPTIKTLIVSMHKDPGMIENLIKNNVDGYVPKNSQKSELLKAIGDILGGKTYFSESIKKSYTSFLFDKNRDSISPLTPREKEVLKLIAQEYTTQEIAEELNLSKHTIEGYRKTLLGKLNVKNLAGLTRYAIKLGLVE